MKQNWLKTIALGASVALLAACSGQTPLVSSVASGSELTGQQQAEIQTGLRQVLGFDTENINNQTMYVNLDIYNNRDYKNILWYNTKTLQKGYTCNVKDCQHDNEKCNSYVSPDELNWVFTDQKDVFLIREVASEDGEDGTTILEKISLDGAKREEIYSVDQKNGRSRINEVFAGEGVLYLDVQTFSLSEKEWFAPSNILYSLDIDTKEVKEVYKLAIPEESQTYLSGTNAEGKLVQVDKLPGKTAFSLVDIQSGKASALKTVSMQDIAYVQNGKYYYIDLDTGNIMCYDVNQNAQTLVTDYFAKTLPVEEKELSAQQSVQVEESVAYRQMRPTEEWVLRVYGDWLEIMYVERSVENTEIPPTKRLVYNIKTEESKEITLTGENSLDGTLPVHIIGETANGLLVIKEIALGDMDGEQTSETEEAVFVENHAMITTEDYIDSKDNFKEFKL